MARRDLGNRASPGTRALHEEEALIEVSTELTHVEGASSAIADHVKTTGHNIKCDHFDKP